ncbi:MAG: selenocysteine lyase, partial [Microbacterium sp.]|nr:selenocysteine lyase [Microbacterium sp.]
TAPLDGLADAVAPTTDLVAFSLVQSATGEVADAAAITAAARRHGARTLVDATQAVGWLPVDAAAFDALVCHAYKWLCAPRGVAFLALGDEYARTLRPVQAGWFAGADPWSSCYGAEIDLAGDARRFDVSPAWQAFVGAAPALELFAAAGAARAHDSTRRRVPGAAGSARAGAIERDRVVAGCGRFGARAPAGGRDLGVGPCGPRPRGLPRVQRRGGRHPRRAGARPLRRPSGASAATVATTASAVRARPS